MDLLLDLLFFHVQPYTVTGVLLKMLATECLSLAHNDMDVNKKGLETSNLTVPDAIIRYWVLILHGFQKFIFLIHCY